MRAEGRLPAPWLFTFADLAALLLAFFVLAFSMSRLDAARWQAVTAAWQERAAAVAERPRAASPIGHSAPDRAGEPSAGRAAYLARILDQRFAALERPYGLRAELAARSVVLRFDPRLLTDRTPASARTAASLRALLSPLMPGLVETRLQVPVASHLPLAEQLDTLQRLGAGSVRWLGRPPDRVLATERGRAVLVLVP